MPVHEYQLYIVIYVNRFAYVWKYNVDRNSIASHPSNIFLPKIKKNGEGANKNNAAHKHISLVDYQ